MKTLPLAEAKAKLSGLIDDVARRDERVTITKHGRPAAVLMSHSEATSLDATLEIMSDPEFYAEILRNRRAFESRRGPRVRPRPAVRRGGFRRSCEVDACCCFKGRPTWCGGSRPNQSERCAPRWPSYSAIPISVSRSNAS